mgnify:CR=1 FL=1
MASTSNLTPGKDLDNKDLEGTSVKGSAFFCYDLWKKVYEDLGEVTALKINTDETGKCAIRYTSTVEGKREIEVPTPEYAHQILIASLKYMGEIMSP